MSISVKEENGQPVITIKEQPQLTEITLGALIELIDGVKDRFPMLQQYLDNLEATALLYDEENRYKWEKEFEVMLYLRNFLIQLRRNQNPNGSL